MSPVPPVAVVVPVKGFVVAKARLAPVLGASARAALAREMATTVLLAAGPMPVTVACDDDEVAAWAREHGASVAWTPGTDLNGAVTAAVEELAASGFGRVVIAHGDLPGARDRSVVVPVPDDGGVVAVPDRVDDGTNVLSVPTGPGFVFAYGPGSFRRHEAEAARLALTFTVLRPDGLTHDVDAPEDLP